MTFALKPAVLLTCLAGFARAASADTFPIPPWVEKSCVHVMNGERSEGIGFLIGVKEGDMPFCYLVTVKQVIQPAVLGSRALRLRLNKRSNNAGESVDFPLFFFHGKPWMEHTNAAVDLAVAPLAIFEKLPTYDFNFQMVDSPTNPMFATESYLDKSKVRPGDTVFSIGLLPVPLRADAENLPITRYGTVARVGPPELAMPGGRQRVHLVTGGAAGSQPGGPAFLLLERAESGAPIPGWRIALFGVASEFAPSRVLPGEIPPVEDDRHQAARSLQTTGIGKVIPVDYLVEILFSDELRQFRKQIIDAQKPPAK